MAYFDLSKLNLVKANVLKAFESWLQWWQTSQSSTEDHLQQKCQILDNQNMDKL